MKVKTESLNDADTLRTDFLEELNSRQNHMIDVIREELAADEESDIEISFSPDDIEAIREIADSVGLEYSYEEDEGNIEITDDDGDKIDEFFSKLDDAGISYENDTESDEVAEGIDEVAPVRKHTKATDKLKHKKDYRKNKSKIKIKQKRYRKTAKFKRNQRLGKVKKRSGKTATGRRITKRI